MTNVYASEGQYLRRQRRVLWVLYGLGAFQIVQTTATVIYLVTK